MRKSKKKLSNLYDLIKQKDSGSANIELIVAFFVLLFLFSMFINILPAFVEKQTLNHIANEIVRTAEITGDTNSEEVNRSIELFSENFGLKKDKISWTGTKYFNESNPIDRRVTINEEIRLTIEKDFYLAGNKLAKTKDTGIKLTMTSTSSGRSEVYHKK